MYSPTPMGNHCCHPSLAAVLKDVSVDVVFSTLSAEALLYLVWKLGREVWEGG